MGFWEDEFGWMGGLAESYISTSSLIDSTEQSGQSRLDDIEANTRAKIEALYEQYRLSIDSLNAEVVDDFGNSKADSFLIALGRYQGSIETTGDVDWFYMPVFSGYEYKLEIPDDNWSRTRIYNEQSQIILSTKPGDSREYLYTPEQDEVLHLSIDQWALSKGHYEFGITALDGGTEIEKQVDGTYFLVKNDAFGSRLITSSGFPDAIDIASEVEVTINARSQGIWGSGYVALHAGGLGGGATNQAVSVEGLSRYKLSCFGEGNAKVSLRLEENKDSAFFLHDSFSEMNAGVEKTFDSHGRLTAARLVGIDKIFMDTAGGTSIVDLTSPDYDTLTGVRVYGASKGTSIFWGNDQDDVFWARGGDAIINAGSGMNTLVLDSGYEQVQLHNECLGLTTITNFEVSQDSLKLFQDKGSSAEPHFWEGVDYLGLTWGYNSAILYGLTMEDSKRIVVEIAEIAVLP